MMILLPRRALLTRLSKSSMPLLQPLRIQTVRKVAQRRIQDSLMTALAEARARKNEVKVSTDGSDIPTTEEWALEAAHTEFQGAITKADGVLNGANKDTEQSVIDDAVRELNAAMNKFDQAAQSGTKPTTPTPNPDPDTQHTSREYSDYYGNEKWDELKDKIAKLIEDGKEGETIEFNATGLPYFPASVARALKGEDITLKGSQERCDLYHQRSGDRYCSQDLV